MPRVVCELILTVSGALRADIVGTSGVRRDFCYAKILPCPWEAGGGWEVLISKCRLVPASRRGGGKRSCWEERTAVTVGVFACLQVDNERRDLDMNNREVDVKKLIRFVRINELRLVTEYDPVVITSSSKFGMLRGRELNFLLLSKLPSMDICHVVPCLQSQLSQNALSLTSLEKCGSSNDLLSEGRLFCITQHIELDDIWVHIKEWVGNFKAKSFPSLHCFSKIHQFNNHQHHQ